MPATRVASVQSKLTVVAMTTCVTALVLAAMGIFGYELLTARQDLARQLSSVADMIGGSSTAAVQFQDAVAAREALNALHGDPDIEAARIDLPSNDVLASLVNRSSLIGPGATPDGVDIRPRSVIVSRAIMLDGQRIGTIHVQGSLNGTYARLREYAMILLTVLGVSCLIAYLLSSRLQRVISRPILNLTSTASRVSVSRDYTLRALKESDDEIGQLVDQFNDMLAQIAQRDEALDRARAELEERVRERTRTLELEIVDRQRAENQLVLAKAAAEEASLAKSAFLANMSHELRTPLNAIIGYSEMLREDAQEFGSTHAITDLDRIVTAGRHLLHLITDVLDLSKIEAGRMEVHLEHFSATDLVATAVATSRTLANARGNTLTMDGVDQLGVMHSDQTKLQQVLLNLIGNAAKFTSNGAIQVLASRQAVDGADWIVIDIVDTGVGMTPEQTTRLFKEFTQADESTTRRYGGTGLGLAISQRLCHLLGGAITVVSESGRGSTFSVRLPAQGPQPQRSADVHATSAARTASAGPDTSRTSTPRPARVSPLILVIDDDETARDLATRALERAEYRVVTASRADEGLRLARTLRPDAVVVDLLMPGTSGWSLITTVKADPDLADTPVIVVSIVDDRQRSLEAGAVEHLLKPLAGDRLVQTLQRVVTIDHAPDAGRLESAFARKSA